MISILSFIAIFLYPQKAFLLLLLPVAVLPGIVLKKSVISAIPSIKISSRKEKVNAYLHQAIVAMLGYAKAGLTLPELKKVKEFINLEEFAQIVDVERLQEF